MIVQRWKFINIDIQTSVVISSQHYTYTYLHTYTFKMKFRTITSHSAAMHTEFYLVLCFSSKKLCVDTLLLSAEYPLHAYILCIFWNSVLHIKHNIHFVFMFPILYRIHFVDVCNFRDGMRCMNECCLWILYFQM